MKGSCCDLGIFFASVVFLVNDLTYLNGADQYAPEVNLLKLLSGLPSAHFTPVGSKNTGLGGENVLIQMYHSDESDLGDGEHVIKTAVFGGAFSKKMNLN